MTEKNGKRKKEKGEETERRTALKEKRKQKTFKLCLPTPVPTSLGVTSCQFRDFCLMKE
jgi:hypothetical protein